jgi:hypothetical protein
LWGWSGIHIDQFGGTILTFFFCFDFIVLSDWFITQNKKKPLFTHRHTPNIEIVHIAHLLALIQVKTLIFKTFPYKRQVLFALSMHFSLYHKEEEIIKEQRKKSHEWKTNEFMKMLINLESQKKIFNFLYV